jgi:hypothetical protein
VNPQGAFRDQEGTHLFLSRHFFLRRHPEKSPSYGVSHSGVPMSLSFQRL